MHVHIHIHIHIYTYMYVCVYIYIYIHIYELIIQTSKVQNGYGDPFQISETIMKMC